MCVCVCVYMNVYMHEWHVCVTYHCASQECTLDLAFVDSSGSVCTRVFYVAECVRLCKVVVEYNHSVILSLHTDKEELFQNVLTQVAEQFSR